MLTSRRSEQEIKMSHVWSPDEIFRLIAELEKRREIWDHSSLDYKNKAKRRLSLENLAAQFDTSCKEIVRKLHNLRTQLNNEYRRVKEKRLEGDQNYVTNWAYFEPMKYMLDTGKLNDLYSDFERHVEGEMDLTSCHSEAENDSQDHITPKRLKIESDVLTKTSNTVVNISPIAVQRSVSNPRDDETFGLFVTSALRNLRTEQCRRKMKRLIQKVILDVEEEDDILSDHF